MSSEKTNLLRGTLELLILRALSGDPRHGYQIVEWLHESSEGELDLVEGTLYPALHRMERKGWIESSWGTSAGKRRAKYYRLTPDGAAQLESQLARWQKHARAVQRTLEAPVAAGS